MRKKIKLGDVLDVKRGMSLSGDYYSSSGKYIRLTLGNFTYPECGWKDNTSKDDLYFIGPVKEECILKKGDIITPLTEQVRGLLGNTATIPESDKYIQSGDIGLIIPKPGLLDKRFAYYLVSSPTVKKQLDAGSQQTKIRHTSPDAIKECFAFIPEDIEEQRSIASALDLLSEKINNLKNINAQLIRLTRDIYNEYFLRFRINGRKLQISEKGVPLNWKTVNISELIDAVTTGLNPRDNFTLVEFGYKYITVKNLTTSCSLDFDGCDFVDESAARMIRKRSKVEIGDILFASIAPLGRCFPVISSPKDWVINESVFCIKPKEFRHQLYLYLFLTSDYFIKKAEHSSTGSVFSGIRISVLNEIQILLPDNSVIDLFNEKVSGMFEKIENNNKEILKLRELSERITAPLLNGQIQL